MRLGVAAVRVEVDRVGDDARARLQQPRRLRIEEVGVAADLVHRPVGRLLVECREQRAFLVGLAVEHLRAPDHVVEHEASADRGAAGRRLRLDVVDFLDLERRDVAILGQAGRHARNLAPPVRRVALHDEFLGLDDQIRRADRPRVAVGVDLRPAACRPDCRSARRCRPTWRSIAISSSLSDGSFWNCWMPMFFSTYHGGITPAFGPMPVRCLMARAHGRDVFVGRQRHRRDAVGAVAVLAAALQDRRDVLREGHFAGVRRLSEPAAETALPRPPTTTMDTASLRICIVVPFKVNVRNSL